MESKGGGEAYGVSALYLSVKGVLFYFREGRRTLCWVGGDIVVQQCFDTCDPLQYEWGGGRKLLLQVHLR